MMEQDRAYRWRELATGEYWTCERAPTPAEKLASMRAAILALKAQIEKPMPGMGNGDIARRLDEIARGEG